LTNGSTTPPTNWTFTAFKGWTTNAFSGTALTPTSFVGSIATYNSNDAYTGNVAVSTKLYNNVTQSGLTFVGARLIGTGIQGATSGYYAQFEDDASGYKINLCRVVASATTTPATVTINTTNVPRNIYYTLSLSCYGASPVNLAVQLKAESGTNSGKWWNGTTWVASAANLLSYTDSSPPTALQGAGYFGVQINAAAGNIVVDDFAEAQNVPPSATAYTLTGPTTGATGVASITFTLTPNGPLGGNDSITLSDGGAGGTFSPTSPLSGTSGSSSALTFTYTAASAGAKTLTVTSATLGLSVTGSPATYTASTQTNADDANIAYSPYNWLKTGSGATAAAATIHPGAWLQITPSGTTSIDLLLSQSGESIQPQLVYFVDAGGENVAQSSASTYNIVLPNTSSHTVLVYVDWTNAATGVWTTPANAWVKIIGLNLNGGTLSAQTLPTQYLMVLGDSISTDEYIASRTPAGARTWTTYVHALGKALGCQVGVVSWPGQGLDKAATATDVPAVFTPGNDTNSAWNKYWSGQSRLTGGLLLPAPTYVLINHGTNATGSSTTQAALTGLLPALRTAAPSTKIVDVIPFGGYQRSALVAGFAAYQTATPDANCKQIDLAIDAGFQIVGRFIAEQAPHPSAIGHGYAAALLSKAIASAFGITLSKGIRTGGKL
jgi:hypothetical protein